MTEIIYVPLKLVSLVSILTIAEFVICTIAVFSISSIFFGLWILKLHREKEIIITTDAVRRSSLIRKLLDVLLGAWFAGSVAMFERGLKELPIVSNLKYSTSSCLRLDQEYDWTTYFYFRPPLSYNLDETSHEIAKQLNCTNGKPVTVDFGKKSRAGMDDIEKLYAPVCLEDDRIESTYSNAPLNGTVDILSVSFGQFGSVSLDPIVEIFPYNITFTNRSRSSHYTDDYKPVPECEKRNISSYSFRHFGRWDIAVVDDYSVSLSIQNELCRLVGNDKVRTNETFKRCWKVKNDDGPNLNMTCVLDKYQPKIFRKELIDATMLVASSRKSVLEKLSTRSSVCTSSDVEISYILLSSNFVCSKVLEFYGTPRLHQGYVPGGHTRSFSNPGSGRRNGPNTSHPPNSCGPLCRRRMIWTKLSGNNRQLTMGRYFDSMRRTPLENGLRGEGSANWHTQRQSADESSSGPLHESSFCDAMITRYSEAKFILVPLRFEANGGCKPTVFPLGRASILHSTNEERAGTKTKSASRGELFWAYTISFSRFILPKNHIELSLATGSSANVPDRSTSCTLNEVRIGTQFRKDI